MKKYNQAFTMTELIVTLLIASILAAVGGVAYHKYALKAKMAEAYVGIDNIYKSEVTYFSEHKTFVDLPSNPGEYQYPGYGSPSYTPGLIIDKRTGNGHWLLINTPFPVGSPVFFSYQAKVGRTDVSGNDVIDLNPPVVQTSPQIMGITYTTSQGNTIPGGGRHAFSNGGVPGCLNAGFLDMLKHGQSQYNWIAISATADLIPSSADDNTNPLCTTFYRVADTDTNGHIRQVVSAGVSNLGE